jgi:hypothetical protein
MEFALLGPIGGFLIGRRVRPEGLKFPSTAAVSIWEQYVRARSRTVRVLSDSCASSVASTRGDVLAADGFLLKCSVLNDGN